MSIIRAPRIENNFYVLDKKISEDKRLSWAARGLLVFLLGKPDHWRVSPQALVNETKGSRKATGRDGVYILLNELIEVGYVTRQQMRSANGALGEVNYLVSEEPAPLPPLPYTAAPCPANPTLVSTDKKQVLKKKQETKGEHSQASAAPVAPAFPPLDVGMALDAAEEAQAQAQADAEKEAADSESKAVEAKAAPAKQTAQAQAQKPAKAAKSAPDSPSAVDRPDDVDAQTWKDWLELRKAKRAPVSATVVTMARREAEKAAMPLEDFLQEWCARGSQGLKAEWLKDLAATPVKRAAAPRAPAPENFADRVYVGGRL